MPTKVFWCEPTGDCDYFFRRYHHSTADDKCPANGSYHDAMTPWYRGPRVKSTVSGDDRYIGTPDAPADAAWPTACEKCGFAFADDDPRQVFVEAVYRRVDTGELLHTRNAPVGAMWDAWWMGEHWSGDDGIHLVVMLVGNHEWLVDGPCSNCTRPGEPHKCWCRHGDPRTGNVTIDKNGNTCSAGGGSIMIPGYHGFLQNGFLTDG